MRLESTAKQHVDFLKTYSYGKLTAVDKMLPLAAWFGPRSQFSHLTLCLGSEGEDQHVLFSGCGFQPPSWAPYEGWCDVPQDN